MDARLLRNDDRIWIGISGRLLRAIDDLGLREDTIFVFTSDHGEMFGAQGRRAKNIFYEEAVRVCRFSSGGKAQMPAGHVSDACLNTPDIMPTLLSHAKSTDSRRR